MSTPENANHGTAVVQQGSALVVPQIKIILTQDNLKNQLSVEIQPPNCMTNAQMAACFSAMAARYAELAIKFESDLIAQMNNMDKLLKKQNGG